MKRSLMKLLPVLLVAAILLPAATATAQDFGPRRWRRPILRIGLDYTVRQADAVREVIVVFGDATIEGHVDRNVVVWLGNARLSNTATIDGSLIVVGGRATAASGAYIGDDLVVIGGTFEGPDGFVPDGEFIAIGPAVMGGTVEAIVPWITRGLLWGRPVVPNIPWVWGVVGVFFLVYLALNLVFDGPVRTTAATLSRTPLTSFVVGLLVLLLTGPVCVLLTVSVIGIAVVPFVICGVMVAGIIGKVAVARSVGNRVIREDEEENRLHAVRSFVIGFALITIAYMVPVLGIISWILLGVCGLGAAALAFMAGYRRENPRVPKRKREPEGQPPTATEAVPPTTPVSALAPAVTSYSDYEPPPEPPASAPAVAFAPDAGSVAASSIASDLASFPRAEFRDRLAAFVLDVILVVIVQDVLDLTRRGEQIFMLLLIYHIAFWTWKSTTVGGIICQIRVVRVDGTPLRFADALVRALASIFSLIVAGIGCLWILKDPERQAWHDKIAGTYVVKVPRNYPL